MEIEAICSFIYSHLWRKFNQIEFATLKFVEIQIEAPLLSCRPPFQSTDAMTKRIRRRFLSKQKRAKIYFL